MIEATVLSTKKLSLPQKGLLLNSGMGFTEYNAITIAFIKQNSTAHIANAIFTSKNAVKAILDSEISVSNCFCVGENTKKLLQKNDLKVIEVAQNATNLAKTIVKKYKNEDFSFFCGNLRRNELPELLKQNNINFNEHIVYNTHLNTKKFSRFFDGVLFFSPSGVQSYVSENTLDQSVAFCIGNTTASEAKKYCKTIVIANKPTVENVIVQVVKYFNKK